MEFHDPDYTPDAFEVRVSELLVATPEASDELIDHAVPEVLRMIREHLKMDVVFVSEFTEGRRVFRRVDTSPTARVIEVGQSSPLEESFCQRVIDGRLPNLVRNLKQEPAFPELPPTDFPIGAHLSTPIVLNDGRVYGTLCCFSFAPNPDLTARDMKKLELSAQLAARKINDKLNQATDKAMANWSLEPQATPLRKR